MPFCLVLKSVLSDLADVDIQTPIKKTVMYFRRAKVVDLQAPLKKTVVHFRRAKVSHDLTIHVRCFQTRTRCTNPTQCGENCSRRPGATIRSGTCRSRASRAGLCQISKSIHERSAGSRVDVAARTRGFRNGIVSSQAVGQVSKSEAPPRPRHEQLSATPY